MRAPTDIEVPRIDAKGGSKVSGPGERFDVNLVTGGASLSLPLAMPRARGVAPELALSYSGTVGNGPYGLGFDLALPVVARLTDKGVPTYTDQDRFLIDGGELTPFYAAGPDGAWVREERTEGDFTVARYRPRIETTSNRIERWRHRDGTSHWTSVSADNATTVYGDNPDARVCDPDAPERVYRWLATRTIDAHGNRIDYRYRREDGAGLPPGASAAQVYVDSIRYGNYRDGAGERFAFEILFDYGQYDLPGLAPARPWATRADPFTTHRPGFELKTWRLCRNILTVHDFPDVPDVGRVLAKVLALTYGEAGCFSALRQARQVGWRKGPDGGMVSEAKPPVTLTFNEGHLGDGRIQPLEVDGSPPFQGPPGRGRYQFVDLHGDGIAGMLFNDASRLVYWRALGEGRYQPPVTPLRAPIERDLADGRCALMDLDGNGRLDLVVRAPQRAGFYRNTDDGLWESFAPFAQTSPELGAPGAELVDLDGDGRQDVMILAEPERLRVYPSRGVRGYAPARSRPAPRAFPSEQQQSQTVVVAFADLFGDGLQHRVRVADGSATVWPSLGHGRFGAPVALANAPRFADGLTAARVFFADMTGSGLADLVFALPDRLAIHRNRAGNGFADAVDVPIPQGIDDLDAVNFADVFGDGRASFVLGKAASTIVQFALRFSGGQAAYHLAQFDNGFGGSTALTYRSSALYRLDAGRRGRPWPTPLGGVYQLVETVTHRDVTTGFAASTRYDYADGYYDPVEREFRGFGYVQSLERPWFSGQERREGSDAAPGETCRSERWNDVGAAVPAARRSVALPGFHGQDLVPDDVLDPAAFLAGGETLREAYRALKEREVAKRVTGAGADGGAPAVAYQTVAQNYAVRMLQPRIDGHPAAFRVGQRQSRTLAQAGSTDEARVTDSYVLREDDYGNPLLSAEIAYPRGQDARFAPQQTALIATAIQRGYINHPETEAEPFRYIGQQWEERRLEIGGIVPSGALFDFAEVENLYAQALTQVVDYGSPFTAGRPEARPYRWTRDVYWNAARDAPLGFGAIAGPGLLYEQRGAVFPPSFAAAVYGERVDAAMLGPDAGRGAGYVLSDGYWWNPGTRRSYASGDRYFVPVAATDPFGQSTDYGYDRYALEMTSSTDALGQVTRSVVDYQALQPRQVVDVNGNATQTVYSPLGSMLAFSSFGTVDGRVVGDKPLDGYRYVAPQDPAEVLADPERFLQGAGSFCWADYFAPARGDGPVSALLLEADRAIEPVCPTWEPGPRRYGATLAYVDAAARPLARQTKVDGAALEPPRTAEAWIVTDQVAYDAQGRVAKRYNTYVALVPRLDLAPAAPCTLTFYDAVGRTVGALLPPGLLTRTRYGTWARDVWDADQTVKTSPFYEAHIGDLDPSFAGERDALMKAAQFEGAHTTFDLDPLGRDCVETRREVFAPLGAPPPAPSLNASGAWHDVAGAVVRRADPRFYAGAGTILFNLETDYDMAGKPVATRSSDRGQSHPGVDTKLFDSSGKLIDRWNNAGARLHYAFDVLRRPTGLRIHPAGGGADYLADSFVYGDDPARNSRNRIVIRRDQAEEALIASYDLSGLPLAETRRFAVDYATPIDWTDPARVPLQADAWPVGGCHNRRGWPMAVFNADGSVTVNRFHVNGWLAAVSLAATASEPAAPILAERRYAPTGKAAYSRLSSGLSEARTYDPDTDRLRTLVTTREHDGVRLQDDRFWYDPVGNVTRIGRTAEPQRFWNGGVVSADNDYTYDSLYRLRIATGRQQAGLGAAGAPASPDPAQAVAYAERYWLDKAGNLTEIRHAADAGGGQGSWTKTFAISSTSNHAVPADWVGGGTAPDDFFDADGNLARLGSRPTLVYDARDQIRAATLVERSEGEDDVEFYSYAGNGQRRRKVKRFVQGPGVTVVEEVLYINALIVTRRWRGTTTGAILDGEARSLSVKAQDERLLLIDRDSAEAAAQYRYQLANDQMSITIEVDEAGQILTFEEYLPYGGRAFAKARSQLDLDTKRFRFVGREIDQATGLYCIGLRYYMAGMGRWLTPDPAGIEDGLNLYAYAGANPTTFVDRNGLEKTRLTGRSTLVQRYQNTMNNDLDVARGMVDAAVDLLQAQIGTRNGWLMGKLWSRGTINQPDPIIGEWFRIEGTTRTDANNLFEILDNFKTIQAYFARPPVQTRLSFRYLKSFFVDTPRFNVLEDTRASKADGTVAYVQGGSLNWPDWRVLLSSVRSRPMGALTLVGVLNPITRGLVRVSPREGINLYEELHFQVSDQNERASTLVHEASHLLFMTDDHAYGRQESQQLSTTRAMYNADSYGLFARAVYESIL